MRITELDIDRFRIWRSLLLKLNPTGLNVIYGPNEAGKTTLMQFVRAILYGFDPLESEPAWIRPEDELPWKGSLRCEHGGRLWRIGRTAAEKTRGKFRISGGPDNLPAEEALGDILCNTSESLYSDIFALGVRELQQLSTWGTEQVSEYIYGLSMGPQGRQLLSAMSAIDERRRRLFSEDCRSGTVPELFSRYSRLVAADRRTGKDREEHARLVLRRKELHETISELQQRHGSVSNELRGLQFLSACFKPWQKARDLRARLEQVPVIHHDPEAALKQLTECEQQIRRSSEQREQLSQQATSLRNQAGRLKIDETFDSNVFAIQGVVDQTDWLAALDDQIRDAQDRSHDLKRELDRAVDELGPAWSVDRLNSIDISSTAHQRLLHAARQYQDALNRRGKLRRMTRSLAKKSQQELMTLDSDLTALGIESVDDAISREQHRLGELENLGRLRLQREQLGLKIKTVRTVMGRVDTDTSIPLWVDRAVMMITIISCALFFLALITLTSGADSGRSLRAALAAAGLSLGGIMWWAIRQGLRNHFDRRTGIQLDDLNDEARDAEKNLRSIHERIQRIRLDGIAGQHLLRMDAPGAGTRALVEGIGECSRHITDLERLSRRREAAMARRRRLRSMKQRYQSAQRGVSEKRREWCSLLTELGLDETVRIREAFDWWQKIQEIRELHTQWRNAAPESEGLRRMYSGMQARIRQLGDVVAPGGKLNFSRPVEVLGVWSQQLTAHRRDRDERERLLNEAEKADRAALAAQHQVEAAELRRGGVLARCGVMARDEIEQQIEQQRVRTDLLKQLESTEKELLDLSLSEPELAVTEEELGRFDPKAGRERIVLLTAELEEVDQQLQDGREELGSLKQKIELLESARGSQETSFQRAAMATKIYRTAEEWFATEYEHAAVQRLRAKFEKENISGTLQTAGSYLHRMTSGRYHRIWAPLGENFLCVDDEYNRSFRVEQLSGGTREQLFLAIRFALVREFARRGIELPMVMDDLFVNFDEERTGAAVDCLLDIAEEGQQVLFFTCHQHLAESFRDRKTEPLWLPGHRVAFDIHKPEDEAAAFAAGDSDSDGDSNEPRNRIGSSGRSFSADADELFDEGSSAEESSSESAPAAATGNGAPRTQPDSH